MKDKNAPAVCNYEEAAIMQASFLNDELLYLDGEIKKARQDGDTKKYAAFMRLYLNAQKEYMKLLSDLDSGAEEADELLSFAGAQP